MTDRVSVRNYLITPEQIEWRTHKKILQRAEIIQLIVKWYLATDVRFDK